MKKTLPANSTITHAPPNRDERLEVLLMEFLAEAPVEDTTYLKRLLTMWRMKPELGISGALAQPPSSYEVRLSVALMEVRKIEDGLWRDLQKERYAGHIEDDD